MTAKQISLGEALDACTTLIQKGIDYDIREFRKCLTEKDYKELCKLVPMIEMLAGVM